MSVFKKNKTLLINTIIFVSALIIIEIFFIINAKFKFLAHAPIHNFQKYSTLEILKPEDFEKKYGFNVLGAPPEIKTTPDPRIKLLKSSQLDYALKFRQRTEAIGKKNMRSDLRFLPPNEDVYIYSANYVFNDDGTRKTEHQEHKTSAKNFVITIGDSFTFGEGVSNGNELASQLTKKISKNWKVYNYGSPGTSTNDFLFEIQHKPDYFKKINEKKGVVVWFYIDAQFERFFCNLWCYQEEYDQYIKFRPYYKYENTDFVYKGAFRDNLEPYRALLQIIGKSETIRFSGVSYKNEHSSEQVDIFAKSFKKLFDEIKQKVPAEKFYFVTLYGLRSKDLLLKKLAEENNITVLDFTETPLTLEGQHLSFPHDGHGTPEFYWLLSELLKSKINFN